MSVALKTVVIVGFGPAASQINSVVMLISGGIIALISHRMILLDENYSLRGIIKTISTGALPIWRFLWRYLAITVLLSILMVSFAKFIYPFLLSTLFFNFLLAAVLAGILVWPIMAIGLALLGTVLPAAATGKNDTFSLALKNGVKRFWRTLLRLALGPGLLSVLSLATLYWALLHARAFLPSSPAGDIVFGIAASFWGLFGIHLTAAVLSLAHLETSGTSQDGNQR